MRSIIFLIVACFFNNLLAQNPPVKVVMVVHGGAGIILPSGMTPEKEAAYKQALENALKTGYLLLQKGGKSLDAVETAVKLLEDNPLFNAGKGAVFTNEGKNELDAAIMNGKTLAAGSVAGVTTIKNPISAARAVMEKSNHVMMVGKGAEQFAASMKLQIVPPSYFHTRERWEGLQKAKVEDSLKEVPEKNSKEATGYILVNKDNKFGTVGAVALDKEGNLAAATSTGGMTNKKFGRVGDAPIIGSGTYANNATCAVSCTGWGEYFIRLVMAKTVSDMMEFGNKSLLYASNDMIINRLKAIGGSGGLIALDKNGNAAMPFNTAGMYRGLIREDGSIEVKIYKD